MGKNKSRKITMDTYSQGFAYEFGGIVKEKREKLNLSMRAAGEQIGITAAYLSDIEKGKERPPLGKVLEKMMQVYRFDTEVAKNLHRLARKCRGTVSPEIAGLINSYENLWMSIVSLCELRDQFTQKGKEQKLNRVFGRVANTIEAVIGEELNNEFPELYDKFGNPIEN